MPVPFIDPSQATLFGEGSRPAQRKPRQADPLFDAITYVCKINPQSLTASGRGQINRNLKELRAVGATPEQIVRRSQVYVEKWRHTPTPAALTRQWAALEESPLAARVVVTPAEEPVSAERRSEIAQQLRAWLARSP